MLFKGRKKRWYYYEGEKKSREEFEKIINEEDGSRVFFKNSFGSMDEKGKGSSSGMPVLTLMGDVNFSGVTIIYI